MLQMMLVASVDPDPDPVREVLRAGVLRRLAQLGSQTMLQMMLVDNLIHSDLHPGNILVALVRPFEIV